MQYQVVYTKSVQKQLNKLSDKIFLQISTKIRQLSANPYSPFLDVKKLKDLEDEYRLRAGDYRIVYKIENGQFVILIISVAHRKDVYK